jgi:hypothetical protein
MDLALIQGTLTGLKVAGDLARGFLDLKSLAEVQGKVIELQSTILAAQGSAMAAVADQTTLIDENRALKDELKRLQAWGVEKARFRLVAAGKGMAYGLRESQKGEDPPHWLCTQCFDVGIKSVMNPSKDVDTWIFYACSKCKTKFPTGQRAYPDIPYAEG